MTWSLIISDSHLFPLSSWLLHCSPTGLLVFPEHSSHDTHSSHVLMLFLLPCPPPAHSLTASGLHSMPLLLTLFRIVTFLILRLLSQLYFFSLEHSPLSNVLFVLFIWFVVSLSLLGILGCFFHCSVLCALCLK